MKNFFAELTRNDETYCYCVEAYVEGLFEQLIGKAPNVEESSCLGKSGPYCEYRVSLP